MGEGRTSDAVRANLRIRASDCARGAANLLDTAGEVEGLDRNIIMLAVEDFTAAPQGIGAADMAARAFVERSSHVERLGEERLQLPRAIVSEATGFERLEVFGG
jgi:hypothetical protein